MAQAISCKGKTDGLEITIRPAAFCSITDELQQKLRDRFFQSGQVHVNVVVQRPLEGWQRRLLSNQLVHIFGKAALTFQYAQPVARAQPRVQPPAPAPAIPQAPPGWKMTGAAAQTLYQTLRSGQKVYYDGDLVVLGDVNPGAHVQATGSIAVLGALRGVAHAGMSGNEQAVVVAHTLSPTQLRIAAHIAIPEGKARVDYPEIARVVKGTIVIDPYLPGEL